ncbi:MAG: hypothetical protein HN348_09620 [Proteobacteria bacterium]|jgi:hypothetical protein|nr:hypothetical protein [Pseudomonadota bacterium]
MAQGRSRWSLSLDQLRSYLRTHENSLVTLVTTTPATIETSSTADHSMVLTSASSLTPQGVGGDAGPLLCSVSPAPTLVVFSDAWTDIDLGCQVQIANLGSGEFNAGITHLQVREADALGLAEVYIGLHATEPSTVEVQLALDEQSLKPQPRAMFCSPRTRGHWELSFIAKKRRCWHWDSGRRTRILVSKSVFSTLWPTSLSGQPTSK